MNRRSFLAGLVSALVLPEPRRVYSFMPGLWTPRHIDPAEVDAFVRAEIDRWWSLRFIPAEPVTIEIISRRIDEVLRRATYDAIVVLPVAQAEIQIDFGLAVPG